MNGHADKFDPVLKNSKKIKKTRKNMSLCMSSSYAYWLQWKMIIMNFDNFWKNLPHNMAYLVWTFMAFNPNDQGHDHIYAIFKIMRPYFVDRFIFSSKTMLPMGVCNFYVKKMPTSIFEVLKMGFVWSKYNEYVAKHHYPNFQTNITINKA